MNSEVYINSIVDEAMVNARGAAEALGPDFCKYWPQAKSVLEAIAPLLPAWIRIVIPIIIGIGDRLCKQ